MNVTAFSLAHRTTILALVAVALVLGLRTLATMPRREDPEIRIRTAVVLTQWPGATAEKVENLVTDPLEASIQQIDEVDVIRSQSLVGQSIIQVDLEETVLDTDQLWDELRAKVDEVRGRLPLGVFPPNVISDYGDVFAVCVALYQRPLSGGAEIPEAYRYSWRQLELIAETVETELKTIPSVAKVDILGVQDEVVYLEVDSADWAKVGMTAAHLARILEARNIVAPGGVIATQTTRYSVRPTGEFEDLSQIGHVLVGEIAGKVPVRLGDLPLTVHRDYVDPPHTLHRYCAPGVRAAKCLLLAISMKSGHNVVEMGRIVQERIRLLQETVLPPDVELTVVNDLPRQVQTRIDDFLRNVVQAIVIVLGVALLLLGWRPALIMATAVPLSMVASLSVVRLFDVELEQFSIASLIIALGMIVDNAIVVSDNALRLIREGVPRLEAVRRGATELAIPILTSTLTTVAAFLPMLSIEGAEGEYVRSLPIVVATTLLVSYVVAMTVTPIMCYWLLAAPRTDVAAPRGVLRRHLARLPLVRRFAPASGPEEGTATYDRVVLWCLAHKRVTLGAAGVAIFASLLLVPLIGNQFFPAGDRDQFFVDVWLPEGASIHATRATCEDVEHLILQTSRTSIDGETTERLANCIAFVGTGGPRLFLTSDPEMERTNYARLVVNTTAPEHSAPWVEELRSRVETIPGARVNVRTFVLGPPIRNPVEVRLIGSDADRLRLLAEEILEVFRETPGTLNASTDWSNASYQVEVDIDHETANLAGVTNVDVANTMSGLISGQHLTTFREGDHLVDIVLRVRRRPRSLAERPIPTITLDDLPRIYIDGAKGKVPLATVARISATWQPSIIARRNRQRTIKIGSQVEEGHLANQVSMALWERLEAARTSLPPGYRLEMAGELEQTEKSSAKIGAAFGMSALLILLLLIWQYNSFAKPLVVLASAPLALIGALTGLFLTGWPLGFMPMLGLISLAGVVINNAIILIDFIQTGVREGRPLRTAVAEAGRLRMRPIVLTTLTTVGGMLPLALFGGPLWAGMAWAIIFGLLFSTVLTLLVTPTLYTLFVERFGMRVSS